MLLANAVRGELVVAPFPDLFRVGAGEHFDGVVQAEIETAFLPDAKDARQKLLRRERAVIGFARRETVVAAATVDCLEHLPEVPKQRRAAAG